EVADAAQRATDQALDLDRPPALAATACLALRSLPGRRRQERVLRRHPASTLALEPARHALLHGRGAEDSRQPLRVEHRAVRLLEEVCEQLERTQLVGPPPVLAAHAAASSVATVTCATSRPKTRCRIGRISG